MNRLNNIALSIVDVAVASAVDLNDFVDPTTLGSYQNFVIPKASFGIDTDQVDEMEITVIRTGGPKPTFRIDDLQIEEVGTPAVYTSTALAGTRYYVGGLRFTIADALAGTVTDGTMPGLSYDQILALAALSNGIVFQRIQDGEVNFSATLNQLSDFLFAGFEVANHFSDGTDTVITLEVVFQDPIILDGSKSDRLTFTINDDLSGLTEFRATARGSLKVE